MFKQIKEILIPYYIGRWDRRRSKNDYETAVKFAITYHNRQVADYLWREQAVADCNMSLLKEELSELEVQRECFKQDIKKLLEKNERNKGLSKLKKEIIMEEIKHANIVTKERSDKSLNIENIMEEQVKRYVISNQIMGKRNNMFNAEYIRILRKWTSYLRGLNYHAGLPNIDFPLDLKPGEYQMLNYSNTLSSQMNNKVIEMEVFRDELEHTIQKKLCPGEE